MGPQQGDDLVAGQRLRHAPLAADDALGGPERVDHGLLGRVHGRDEERVELAAGERLRTASGRAREEDLAAAVVGT
jgi:hypothetical protein